MSRRRLDEILVQRGIMLDLSEARGCIMAGEIFVSDTIVDKAGQLIHEDDQIEYRPRKPGKYVSRAGEKLEAALKFFKISCKGLTVLDVGSSTGGFTECLLEAGAAKIYAVDCGTNQLAWKLRNHPSLVIMEKTNARELESLREVFSPAPSFATIDVSFISLTQILEPVLKVMAEKPSIVALVKPHFELPSEKVQSGGVVEDPKLHSEACEKIALEMKRLGFTVSPPFESPLKGLKGGNREFFLYAHY